MSPALPSALIVDFAGVMTTSLGASWAVWNARLGLPPRHWRIALHDDPAAHSMYRALECGEIGQTEWNAWAGRVLGVDGTNLMGRGHAEVRAAEPMMAVVRAARQAGVAVALLSNSYGTDPYDPYRELGVWDLCDVHVISEREGIAKPDPAIYQRTLDRLGLPGSACVFVDDRAENLTPARALGITTVHATSPQTAADEVASLFGLTCDATS
ncbi:HAD family hydrolase [Streptomyces sp. 5.8]|uniref:HAD family hydrolase n=1 Tax=Streptomyces sp. 5.8 TaxID=3406571 RepID=UPI003BB71EEF